MESLLIGLVLLVIFIVNLFLLISFLGMFWSTTAGAPFVPTGMRIARQMVELAKIKPGERVFDLGCGDGRIVFLAAGKGAEAIGVEISFPVFLWAKLKQKLGRNGGVIQHGSLWKVDLRDADVIFTYLFPHMMARFETELYPQLKKDCRIISHGFALKNLTPEKTWQPPDSKRGKIMIYRKR